jgi:energy-coupling factor transporter ATP-binding protein EcfA2
MGDIKTIINTALIGSAMHHFMGDILSSDNIYRKWYDWWNNIFVFPAEYTDLIDLRLMMDKKSVVGVRIVQPGGKYIPGLGSHKLYWKDSGSIDCWNYIVFEKHDKDDEIFYVCYVTTRQMEIFEDVVKKLLEPAIDMVRTISIDTSRGAPFPMFLDKTISITVNNNKTISIDERAHQKETLDRIVKDRSGSKNKNQKIMLCGKRGSGKSYVTRLLSKRIEGLDKSVIVRLYDDFNPSLPGVSVALLALQYAKPSTPVIILIDEIDKHYDKAIDGTHADRFNILVHSRDIPSLNKMLDMIGDTKNVIAIYTTEKSPEKLYKNKKYHSFMRKGRVDKFFNFTPNKNGYDCTEYQHTDIVGYVDEEPDSESEPDSDIPDLEKNVD